MAGEDKKNDTATGNAPGGRGGLGGVGGALGDAPAAGGALSSLGGNKSKDKDSEGSENEGFGLDNKDVKGSLKVHIKLDLEADIRIIAKIKGDIAIGLL